MSKKVNRDFIQRDFKLLKNKKSLLKILLNVNIY